MWILCHICSNKVYCFIGNFVSDKAKTLREDAHSRVWKLLLAATALGAQESQATLCYSNIMFLTIM
jgi:hypothetical protein